MLSHFCWSPACGTCIWLFNPRLCDCALSTEFLPASFPALVSHASEREGSLVYIVEASWDPGSLDLVVLPQV